MKALVPISMRAKLANKKACSLTLRSFKRYIMYLRVVCLIKMYLFDKWVLNSSWKVFLIVATQVAKPNRKLLALHRQEPMVKMQCYSGALTQLFSTTHSIGY